MWHELPYSSLKCGVTVVTITVNSALHIQPGNSSENFLIWQSELLNFNFSWNVKLRWSQCTLQCSAVQCSVLVHHTVHWCTGYNVHCSRVQWSPVYWYNIHCSSSSSSSYPITETAQCKSSNGVKILRGSSLPLWLALWCRRALPPMAIGTQLNCPRKEIKSIFGTEAISPKNKTVELQYHTKVCFTMHMNNWSQLDTETPKPTHIPLIWFNRIIFKTACSF